MNKQIRIWGLGAADHFKWLSLKRKRKEKEERKEKEKSEGGVAVSCGLRGRKRRHSLFNDFDGQTSSILCGTKAKVAIIPWVSVYLRVLLCL